ncbi:MAG: DedA family protein [Oligoflexus sp.]
MGISEDQILQFFASYAYQPILVYTAVIVLMALSSFGFPAPEEITLLATGLVCYMGTRPDLYPPPSPDAVAVNVYVAATICFIAVFASDFLVYSLGRHFGSKLLRTSWLKKYKERMEQVSLWVRKYGQFAAGIFRFTPGLRFPGHFSCGMMGLAPSKFVAVDGTAALLSVPTQVFLIAFFGEEILVNIKQFKFALLLIICGVIIFFLGRRWLERRRQESQAT